MDRKVAQVANVDLEYLMRLNTASRRSYNDLMQYPVMPWVLADYCSDTIDLADPDAYRDLSKPIGALNPDRLEHFKMRADALKDDPSIPHFLYGSHYSTSGAVTWYLIRLQPFTQLAHNLQGGKFDLPTGSSRPLAMPGKVA